MKGVRVVVKLEGSVGEVSNALSIGHLCKLPADGILTYNGDKYRIVEWCTNHGCFGETMEVSLEKIHLVKSQAEVMAEKVIESAKQSLENAESLLKNIKDGKYGTK